MQISVEAFNFYWLPQFIIIAFKMHPKNKKVDFNETMISFTIQGDTLGQQLTVFED